MTRIKEIFAKIKEGHPLWKSGGNVYKKRLEKAFEPLFIELEELGVVRHFAQALLFFGKDFVDSLGISQDDDEDISMNTQDAELIFGVKKTKMEDREIREAKLAEKSGALAYRSMPMKGDQVGIKVLKYKKK